MAAISVQEDTGGHASRRNSRCNFASKDSRGKISDGDLLARLMKARGTEREVQRGIVCDLAEVERRRLYLPLAYGSLFEFCTDYLNYSRSTAGRRIRAARCIARFPRMAEMFRRGEFELTVLVAIAGIVTKENCAEIAGWLRGRSLREVEAFARRRQPERALRDRVRQVYVRSVKKDVAAQTETVPASPTGSGNEGAPGAADAPESAATPGATATQGSADAPRVSLPTEGTDKNRSESTPSAGTKLAQLIDKNTLKNRELRTGTAVPLGEDTRSSSTGLCAGTALGSAEPPERVVVEKKFKIEFAVEPAFMDKRKRILSLLSAKYPGNISFEVFFDIVMTDYLDRHSPESRIKKRSQRREKKKKRDIEKGESARNREQAGKDDSDGKNNDPGKSERGRRTDTKEIPNKRKGAPKGAARNRHIPQPIRDEVFVRDGGRCTYVSPDGKRCNETRNLQIDHIIPYAKGGDHSPENLRLLCFKHNQLEAEKEYGKNHMEKYKRRE